MTLTAAEISSRLIPRPRLVGRLIAAQDTPLVLLVAPAGYGKTTLLAEWAQRDGRPFAWVEPEMPAQELATVCEGFGQAAGVLVFDSDELLDSPDVDRGHICPDRTCRTGRPGGHRGAQRAVARPRRPARRAQAARAPLHGPCHDRLRGRPRWPSRTASSSTAPDSSSSSTERRAGRPGSTSRRWPRATAATRTPICPTSPATTASWPTTSARRRSTRCHAIRQPSSPAPRYSTACPDRSATSCSGATIRGSSSRSSPGPT